MSKAPCLPMFRNHPAAFPTDRFRGVAVEGKDGDTIWFAPDQGFGNTTVLSIRLAGCNTPELDSKDLAKRARAAQAARWIEDWVLNRPVEIVTAWDRSFERWVADVVVWSGYVGAGKSAPYAFDLRDTLIAANLADPYLKRVRPATAPVHPHWLAFVPATGVPDA